MECPFRSEGGIAYNRHSRCTLGVRRLYAGCTLDVRSVVRSVAYGSVRQAYVQRTAYRTYHVRRTCSVRTSHVQRTYVVRAAYVCRTSAYVRRTSQRTAYRTYGVGTAYVPRTYRVQPGCRLYATPPLCMPPPRNSWVSTCLLRSVQHPVGAQKAHHHEPKAQLLSRIDAP